MLLLGYRYKHAVGYNILLYSPLCLRQSNFLLVHVFAVDQNLANIVLIEIVALRLLAELVLESIILNSNKIVFDEIGQ